MSSSKDQKPAKAPAKPSKTKSALRSVRDLVFVLGSFAVVIAFVWTEPSKPNTATSAAAAQAPSSSGARRRARPAVFTSDVPTGAALTAAPASDLSSATCDVRDQGLGDFTRSRSGSGVEVYVSPRVVAPDGSYDLLLHFHGGRAVARVLCPASPNVVLATIDRGDSSGDYAGTFRDRRAFDDVLAGIDNEVAKALGRPARARHVALSSFSAGYGATREALAVAADDATLSAVLLFDSLYGSYKPGGTEVDDQGLERFSAVARRALMEEHFTFALTHSDVPTYGYASTGEVATTLLDLLLVRASVVPNSSERGLHRVAQEQGFLVRGYGGSDRDAHCAHLALVPELVDFWRARL